MGSCYKERFVLWQKFDFWKILLKKCRLNCSGKGTLKIIYFSNPSSAFQTLLKPYLTVNKSVLPQTLSYSKLSQLIKLPVLCHSTFKCSVFRLTKRKDYNTAKYCLKMTKYSDISNGYTVLLQEKSVNQVCITHEVMYV